MVTETQQAIFEELDKYADIETMREKAQEIADNVAKRDNIESCSRTYVLRMIKRREDSSAKVQIKVVPPEPEEPKGFEEEEPEISFDEDEDDWEFDADEKEPEPDEEEKPRPADMPLEQILSKENVEMIISVPFRMAADFTGWDGAELTAGEKKRLTPMARQIMLKYLPDLMQMYFVEILFVLVTGEIIVSKYRAYNQFSSEMESKKKAQEEATKQAEIAEKRRLEQEEEAARKAAETPPVPPEPERPRTKEEAGDPTWNKPEGLA